ncbi:SLATT domain-containing protein [Novosphingobium sp. THN1]|jgi:hypothetical protein|uniref:SLATT domain-containing protein n=1 Tax=Novosphingobium sp. THN1 TaxID=1016987 RepID=UPI0013C36359|nr:SLATT domain-containing protein [Novosphingobium sp. THN1]
MENEGPTNGADQNSEKSDLVNQIDNLLWNIRSTAGSRFAAAKRLERRDRSLTSLTAFSSAYIIILTVLPYIIKSSQSVSDRINLVTVAMAVVVLVSSLLQYSSGDIVNAEQYHRSALELKELRREIKAMRGSLSIDQFIDYSAKYSRILEKYSVNHDDIDYLRYKLENPSEFEMTKWQIRLGNLRLRTANSRPVVSLIFVTLVCGYVAYFSIFAANPAQPAPPAARPAEPDPARPPALHRAG